MNAYLVSVATFAALNVILALGLNLISGLCGQISLGHAAFYGIGAYATALSAVSGVPFGLALLIGALAAGLAGVITGQKDAYEYLGASIEQFPQGRAMCEMMSANGFREAEVETMSFGVVSIYTATK